MAVPVFIERRCGCLAGTKRLPLRRYAENLARLAALAPQLAEFGYLELLSYRCGNCKQIVDLTLRDLLGGEGLSPG
jgi:hypothetical protein